MASKRGWEFGIVGGVLGLIALALPWLVVTATALGQYISIGVSPIQMFQGIGNSSSFDTSLIPQDLLTRLEASVGVLLLGIGIYVIGCIVSFVRPHGGFVMLAGVIIAAVGTLSFGTYSVIFASLSLGPGAGEGLGFIAALIAMVGVFVKDPQLGTPFVPTMHQIGVGSSWPPPPPPAQTPVFQTQARTCPSCGLVQSPTNMYCSKCGMLLS